MSKPYRGLVSVVVWTGIGLGPRVNLDSCGGCHEHRAHSSVFALRAESLNLPNE